MNPFVAADLAVRSARAQASSARPDAPVQPDPAPRTPRRVAARTRVAARLHGLAHWVEPA